MTTLQQIIDDFRERNDDLGTPPLWSDAVLQSYANEAQVEACRRARLIEDRETASVCEIAVSTGTSVYAVDKRVIRLRRLKLASQANRLQKMDERVLDRMLPSWESLEAAPPEGWIPWGSWQVKLVPAPDASDTARLWVVREPLLRMRLAQAAKAVSTLTSSSGTATATIAADTTLVTGDTVTVAGANEAGYNGDRVITVVDSTHFTFPVSGSPTSPATGTMTYAVKAVDAEIAPRYAEKLVHWMLWRALSIRDKEEKYDAEGAKRHLDEFESEFGKRSSAIDETWIARHHEVDDLDGTY